MRYDRTQIAIRQRGIPELLDLSLRLARLYWVPIGASIVPLVVPLAILNAWILRWIIRDEYSAETISWYVADMLLLVSIQAPLASLPTTALLGRVMFLQDYGWRPILADLRRVLPGILWTQGLIRGGWLLLVLMVGLRPGVEVSRVEVWLFVLAIYNLVLRVTYPFINEIVLLERNPVRPHPGSGITIGRRSRALHQPNLPDLIGRWLISTAAIGTLTVSLLLSLWFVVGLLTYNWHWGPLVVQVIVPFSFWVGASYATVVRFMHYIDLRIRREGWEVELKVRAAAQDLRSIGELEGQAV